MGRASGKTYLNSLILLHIAWDQKAIWLLPRVVSNLLRVISSRGVIPVRPDDFVVWHEKRQPSDYQTRREEAIRQALCLRHLVK
jgi:hypothetical protein